MVGAALTLAARNGIATSTKVRVAGVNNYAVQGSSNLPNSIANSNCFQQGMTGQNWACSNSPTSPPWTVGSTYADSAVWDTDFVDPQAQTAGADSTYFDTADTAIAYFTGHGICSGCEGGAACTASSQCTAPNAGSWQKSPGTCRAGPPGSISPTCCYVTDRALYTSSSTSSFSNQVIYSNTWGTRFVGWGESSTAGGWSGVGTNGGANMIVLDISCGVLPPFWVEQLQPAFAGLQFLATIMPVTGDTANVADRGRKFAYRWMSNPTEAMANAWTNVLDDLDVTSGSPCVGSNYNSGGGHGINGCGCNFITSFDTQARAYNKMAYGTWSTIRDDSNDGIASSHMYWYAKCNYNAQAYPWSL